MNDLIWTPADIWHTKMYEVTMLNALNTFLPIPSENISIRTPCPYHFNRKTATQILEDLNDTVDIKTVMESPGVSAVFSPSMLTRMGHILGVWLRTFHW
jgi:hypothetical protein